MSAKTKVFDAERGFIDAVPLRPPKTWKSLALTPLCILRRHRPERRVNGDVWRCACGKQAWRDAHDVMMVPGSGLAFKFRKTDS